MNECINCGSSKTQTYRNDDGCHVKECWDCGHVGGPYVSQQ